MTLDDLIPDNAISGWDIALSLLTLILTLVAFRFTRRLVQAAVDRVGGLSPNARAVVVRAAKYLVLLLGIGVALTFLGAQLQPLLTATLILAVIALLALRGVAENFGAGMVIQTRKPVALGDEIESQGHVGVVTELNGRAVVITTAQGRIVHLPNADIIGNPLSNNTAHGSRRSEVEVRWALSGDGFPTFADTLIAAASSATGVFAEPAPDVVVVTVDPHRVTVRLRFWHDPHAEVRITSNVVTAVAADLLVHNVAGTVTSAGLDTPVTPSRSQ